MKFLDLIHDSNLEQIVSFPTRKDHVLDLFMTNRPSLVNRCEPPPGIVDHDIVYIDITAKINKLTQRKKNLWEKADNTKLDEKYKHRFSLKIPPNDPYPGKVGLH